METSRYGRYVETYALTREDGTLEWQFFDRNLRDYFRTWTSVSDPLFPKRKEFHGHLNDVSEIRAREIGFEVKRINPLTPNRPEYFHLVQMPSQLSSYVDSTDKFALASHHPEAYDRTLKKALEALKDSKFNAAIAFAERKKTARTILDRSRKIAEGMLSIKRGLIPKGLLLFGVRPKNPREAARLWNRRKGKPGTVDLDASRLLLEYQYGWKPLLSDCFNSAELLAKRVHEDVAKRLTVRVTTQTQFPLREYDVSAPHGWKAYGFRYPSKTVSRMYLKFGYDDRTFSADLAGLGIFNPLSVAWEVTPWSFVIDWFIPISGYLDLLDSQVGLEWIGGWYSARTTENDVVFLPPSQIVNGDIIEASGYGYAKSLRKDRFLINQPSVPLPSFKNPVSGQHVANALALLRARIR